MKKYVKPELLYESFVLSEQIAVGCSPNLIANYADKMQCFVSDSSDTMDRVLFVEGNHSCTAASGDDIYCYHNGDEGINIFTS